VVCGVGSWRGGWSDRHSGRVPECSVHQGRPWQAAAAGALCHVEGTCSLCYTLVMMFSVCMSFRLSLTACYEHDYSTKCDWHVNDMVLALAVGNERSWTPSFLLPTNPGTVGISDWRPPSLPGCLVEHTAIVRWITNNNTWCLMVSHGVTWCHMVSHGVSWCLSLLWIPSLYPTHTGSTSD